MVGDQPDGTGNDGGLLARVAAWCKTPGDVVAAAGGGVVAVTGTCLVGLPLGLAGGALGVVVLAGGAGVGLLAKHGVSRFFNRRKEESVNRMDDSPSEIMVRRAHRVSEKFNNKLAVNFRQLSPERRAQARDVRARLDGALNDFQLGRASLEDLRRAILAVEDFALEEGWGGEVVA